MRVLLAFVAILIAAPMHADGEQDPLAVAFGTLPVMWNARLSPDGSMMSYLTMHSSDLPIAVSLDVGSGEVSLLLASKRDDYDLNWCDWATNDRLVCGFYGVASQFGDMFGASRLVAVDRDGSDMRVLLQGQLRNEGQFSNWQDRIVDWLVDSPKYVLVAKREGGGTGTTRLNIHNGRSRLNRGERDGVWSWLSDGRGTPRCRLSIGKIKQRWSCRGVGDADDWRIVDESRRELQRVSYHAAGFGDDPNHLMALKNVGGRIVLWREDLANPEDSEVVFAHPDVDIDYPMFIGKHRRMVGVWYTTDRLRVHFFDAAVQRVVRQLEASFPDRVVSVVDESWDRRFYLVWVGSDVDPGSYYRLDLDAKKLVKIGVAYPKLAGRALAPMRHIDYTARDGVQIPAYLTLPPGGPRQGLPAVILPHGGPTARDEWGFDWIAQFLAARGYAVLQANYRGSGGYGEDWVGDGGFKDWKRAMADLSDGATHLVDSGIADPKRMCMVGWSYGGYASLLSVAVEPDRYRCAVAIAPVADPWMWVRQWQGTSAKRAASEFVGNDDEVLTKGSPRARVGDIQVPVLLFHGDEDINVSVEHARSMAEALEDANKSVSYVEYEEADHGLRRNAYRIDMLTRIGTFLDEHTGVPR